MDIRTGINILLLDMPTLGLPSIIY